MASSRKNVMHITRQGVLRKTRGHCDGRGMTGRITIDGKLVLSTEQAAAEQDVTEAGLRSILAKLDVKPLAVLGAVYSATDLRRALRARPGTDPSTGRPKRRDAEARRARMVELHAEGWTNVEIARELGVAESTVSRGLRS